MRQRNIGLGLLALLLVVLAVRAPSADIRIMTHDRADPAPKRVQAAVDLGLMAVSLLVTWTARR